MEPKDPERSVLRCESTEFFSIFPDLGIRNGCNGRNGQTLQYVSSPVGTEVWFQSCFFFNIPSPIRYESIICYNRQSIHN